jgi:hypothetical protein
MAIVWLLLRQRIGESMFKPRLPRTRRASVLIIVIVLLLLLAILGAAYISTSHGDRLSSAQSLLNADADSQIDGIANLVAGTIWDDLNDYVQFNDNSVITTSDNLRYPLTVHAGTVSTYRNSYLGTFVNGSTYNVGDILSDGGTPPTFYICNKNLTVAGPPGTAWTKTNRWPGVTGNGATVTPNGNGLQPWLADRIPVAGPMWPNITQLLAVTTGAGATTTTPTSILGTAFESPDGAAFPNPQPAQYTNVVPASVTSTSAGTDGAGNLAFDGSVLPALMLNGTNTVIAADADNDGIADSLLFRIPGAYFDGLTWYAAVRIIDNNSAINVNTAYSRDNDYALVTGGGTPTALQNYYGLFQSSVGLWELLNAMGDNAATPPAELAPAGGLDNYLFGGGTAQVWPNPTPLDESTTNIPGGAPITRNDYQYITLGDAMYHGLIRRLANPGIDYAAAGGYTRYAALPLSDEAALASHFCLKTVNSTNVKETLVEQYLHTVLYDAARQTGYYSPSQAGNWFSDNFFNTSAVPFTAPTQAVRPYIVTRNPVSNYVQPVFDALNVGEPINPRMLPWGTGNNYAGGTTANYNHFRGTWTANPTPAYLLNDVVLYNTSGTTPPTPGYTYAFICISSPPGTGAPAAMTGANNTIQITNTNWRLQPWSNHPVKANVNSATFPELFRAFWCVMAGNPANGVNQPPFNNWTAPVASTTNGQPTAASQEWNYNPYDSYFAAVAAGSYPSSSWLWHQFRSPLRDPTANSGTPSPQGTPGGAGNSGVTWMDPNNVAQLRAALAAVNTLGLRDQTQNVISRQIPIQVYLGGVVPGYTNTGTAIAPTAANAYPTWTAQATVYSCAPQPFITEVYATNDPAYGTGGYVGIELYNPYPFTMTCTNWQVAFINRLSTETEPPTMTVAQLSPNPLGNPSGANFAFTIPGYSYALLENIPVTTDTGNTTNAGNATARPAAIQNANVPATGPTIGDITHVYVNNLQNVMAGGSPTPVAGAITGGEFVLLRPRRADGTYTANTDPSNNYNEGGGPSTPNYPDLVPIDSYDFTGLSQGGTTVMEWSYIRQKPAAATAPTPPPYYLFAATNGGVYIGNAATGTPRQEVTGPGGTGLNYPTEVETGSGTTMTVMTPQFGAQFPAAGAITPPYPAFPPMQIYNTSTLPATSPNAIEVTTAGATVPKNNPQGFPFGGFARNGDMLNIPFVGAYRIVAGTYDANFNFTATSAVTGTGFTSDNVVELNALPMDCAFADDGDSSLSYPPPGAGGSDDAYENVGRFCPTTARVQQGTPPSPPAIPTTDYYFWTRRLFDYLTVQSNDSNYMANFDPGLRDDYGTPAPATYFPGAVTQVYNSDGAAPDQTNQDTVGVEGLININTAPASVLALLPLVTKGDEGGTSPTADCQTVANAIVTYRNQNGPFMSIFDLNKVPGFQTANGKIAIGSANTPATAAAVVTPGAYDLATSANGVLTPPDANFPSSTPTANNGLTEDYLSDNLVLSRISNMITTRSDTFTVYIVIEGWQNAILPGQTYTKGPPAAPLPQLKVVRHYAFIADRSAINQDPTSRFLRTLTVPNN